MRANPRVKIYKNAWFAKFARRERITDAALCDAIARAERGLIDADLGGGVIKQRVAREGAGKSGGYRTLILFRQAERAIFAFGFAKSDQDNLSERELVFYKRMAKLMLALTPREFEMELKLQALEEVRNDHKDL